MNHSAWDDVSTRSTACMLEVYTDSFTSLHSGAREADMLCDVVDDAGDRWEARRDHGVLLLLRCTQPV